MPAAGRRSADPTTDSGLLTDDQRQALLARARGALARHLGLSERPAPAAGSLPAGPRGAFVTLRVDGELRGCIGALTPSLPLPELVDELAVAAASRDPRFPALTAGELPRTRIEISVLSPPRPVDSIGGIHVGRDGLMVGRGPRRGVLLPQVAQEQGWDSEAFLRHTCLKAGLDGDVWREWAAGRDDSLEVQVFSAQILREPEP